MRGGEQRFRAPANRATDVLLRTHCGEISPLSRRIPLSLSLPFMRQNFPLMSNNRTDFHFVLSIASLSFSLFLSLTLLFPLSLFPSHLFFTTHDYCICTVAVVLNFHVSSRRNKRVKKEKWTPTDFSPRFKRGTAAKKRGTRVFFGAQLIEVRLCARPLLRESARDGGCGMSSACTSIPHLRRGLLASTNLGWWGREVTGGPPCAVGRTDIN